MYIGFIFKNLYVFRKLMQKAKAQVLGQLNSIGEF